MRNPLPILTGLVMLFAFHAQAAPTILRETRINYPLPLGEMQLTESIVQDGPLAINRFRMYRLRRPNIPPQGAILLLPSLGNNFRGYLWNEDGDITKSFAAFFVRAGYEVWGYSPRETGIATGTCGVSLDCSPALNWSLQTVIDDVTFIRSRIKLVFPVKDPVIGGLSLGAVSAIAVINQYPRDYAGLLAWEGSPATSDPLVMAHNTPFCNQYRALVTAGVPVDDQNLPFVKTLAVLARTAPNAPFLLPVPGFPPGLTNLQAFVLVMSAPNPIAPSPRPGFITAAGDFLSGQFFYSEKRRLFAAIAEFNDVTANRVGRDLYCSLAGLETSYTDRLSRFRAPVLIIKAGQGFGTIMDELPARISSPSISSIGINAYAHIDHLGTPLHALQLETPILFWLNTVL